MISQTVPARGSADRCDLAQHKHKMNIISSWYDGLYLGQLHVYYNHPNFTQQQYLLMEKSTSKHVFINSRILVHFLQDPIKQMYMSRI